MKRAIMINKKSKYWRLILSVNQPEIISKNWSIDWKNQYLETMYYTNLQMSNYLKTSLQGRLKKNSRKLDLGDPLKGKSQAP